MITGSLLSFSFLSPPTFRVPSFFVFSPLSESLGQAKFHAINAANQALSFVKQNVLLQRVNKLLNEPPYGRQNQTKRRYIFRKTSAMKS